jgi:hypothetical protein
VFKNGLALRGSDIHSIVPDWHSTMGWYKSHKLGSDDWAELRQKGVENKIKEIMYDAQTLAKIPASVQLSLEEAKSKYLLS